MKQLLFAFIAISVSFVPAQAQQLYSDCDKPLSLEEGTSKYVLLSGSGVNEIQGDERSIHWFDKEHHSCWVKMIIKKEGELTIELEPGDAADVNFLLFRYNGGSFCSDVKEKKALPLRSNLAAGKAKTGLSAGAKEEFVGSSSEQQYSRSLLVKPGEVYYLVVDHNSVKGGNVMIGYSVNADAAARRAPVQIDKNDLSLSVPLTVKIIDDETGQPLVADVAVSGLVPSEIVKEKTSTFTSSLSSSQSIRIDCTAPGYMLASHSLVAPALDVNSPPTFQPVSVEMRLKKIKEGDKVTLSSIKFQPDKAEFMPGSYPTLQALAAFLKSNPDVKIEIGGHINGPDGSSAAGKAMSKKRAMAVHDYLVKSGIEKRRLKYKGYGNSQMIHPNPINERQADENRRVEIRIISK